MYRFAIFLFLGLSLTIIPLPAPAQDANQPPKKEPTAEDLKKAAADLGSPRFAVRERAKKLLAEAGAAAEPYLEEAARSPDEETASSAKAILEKFEWGLYPDTPKEARVLIDSFRSGSPEKREQAIATLLKRNPAPFPTVRRLIAREDNQQLRENMRTAMYQRVRELIPGMLVRGEIDPAEELLQDMLLGAPSSISQDYAAFMYLRGKLAPAIARLETHRRQKGEAGRQAAEALVYLYRGKSDWAAAGQAALDAKNQELATGIAWQANDWKTLASDPKISVSPFGGNVLGASAALCRLAGDTKEFDAKIAEIISRAEDSRDRETIRSSAVALLLNGKSNEAVKILSDRKREMAFTFELLCAQRKYKEAFALTDEARRGDTDPQERDEIELRRARLLYQLGEKDSAIQLFRKMAEEILMLERKQPIEQRGQQFNRAHSVVTVATQIGLRDIAFDFAGKFISLFSNSTGTLLLGAIFGANADVAQTWLDLMRRDFPNEETAVALKRISDILNGTLDKTKLNDCADRMLKNPPEMYDLRGTIIGRRQALAPNRRLDIVASAYKAAAYDTKAEEFLKKAAETAPTPERWIALGDFHMEKKNYREAAVAYAKTSKSHGVADDYFNFWNYGPALGTYLHGCALLSAGDAGEGKRLVDLAHWLSLGDESFRTNLVRELSKRGWADMAHREADFLLKTGYYDSVLHYLCRNAVKEMDYFRAAEYYEKGIVANLRGTWYAEPAAYMMAPQFVRICRARGDLAKGDVDKAQREAFAILETTPGIVEIGTTLIPDFNKLGKKKEAAAIYDKLREPWEKLCKDYPNSGYAHNSLAWIMAICGGDLDVALKHAQKAVELEPDNAQHVDTLAEVHFRKGDRDKALSLIKKCIDLDPKRPYYRKQLGRFKDQPFDSLPPDPNE